MNKSILIGHVCQDPFLSETLSGVPVVHFTIAVNRHATQDGEKTSDFFNVTAWRGLAESVGKYCKKGSKVFVTGSIQIREYEDNNGLKKNAVDVIAQEVEFLS